MTKSTDQQENPKEEMDIQDVLRQEIGAYLPCGFHQRRMDAQMTLLFMNDAFLDMLGYTRGEISSLFHDRYVELIHEEDRKRVKEGLQEQIGAGQSGTLEYRVMTKSGQMIWVLEKSRQQRKDHEGEEICCILVDITAHKKSQEEKTFLLERYQVIMNQATDIVFEWDVKEDTLEFSTNWYKKFGYEPVATQISKNIPYSRNIHKSDRMEMENLIKEMAAGAAYLEREIRILNSKKEYIWCRIRATMRYDTEGKPGKAIGVITDVDADKKQKQDLYEQAQRDALTGLYNKAVMKAMVEQQIQNKEENELQALFLLDIDFFKAVNDTYGHLAGDSVLSDVATILKQNVKDTGLVGRIGGDEFLIYFSNLKYETDAVAKADQLLEALYTIKPRKDSRPISCSIGAVTFLGSDMDYTQLFQKADQALYCRKKSGRGGFTLYKPSLSGEKEDALAWENQSAVGEENDFNKQQGTNEQLALYAFRTLYQAEDVKEALERLLEIIGRSYDVSRVYIFENSEDGSACSNTFEWCNTGVEPQIEGLQNLSYHSDLNDYNKRFEENKINYCADVGTMHQKLRKVLEPQGIRSMLHCAMLDGKHFVGFVGFDECRDNRAWSPKQVESFKLLADVFAVFLVRQRQKQRLLSL